MKCITYRRFFYISLSYKILVSWILWNHKNLWYAWVALSHKFASSTKTYFEKVSFLTETENQFIREITSPTYKQKMLNPWKLPPPLPNLNVSTVMAIVSFFGIFFFDRDKVSL